MRSILFISLIVVVLSHSIHSFSPRLSPKFACSRISLLRASTDNFMEIEGENKITSGFMPTEETAEENEANVIANITVVTKNKPTPKSSPGTEVTTKKTRAVLLSTSNITPEKTEAEKIAGKVMTEVRVIVSGLNVQGPWYRTTMRMETVFNRKLKAMLTEKDDGTTELVIQGTNFNPNPNQKNPSLESKHYPNI
jgi:hypothetical protein